MRVKWLREASRNLEQEADYLADKKPDAADAMLQNIRSSVSLLAQQPGIGRPGRVPGTRELVIQHSPYLIPYRVRGDVLEVLRVFHTSRKPPEKW
ncbi:MAG: type II toxin-antitoxin system RelE/ParE family toxin [Pseudomonadota bacterium]|nr:type II toxin-antitoxin system RelE/ParE family toxin [Pseudomonadota bacterium]MDP1905606.1 type II toxin-antitoxin system RelE/ParE family toxin [Pseudomonadota bacterium]MDP2351635.1 type II toxin-antitoxin system RelE/ParE family toxin [Pseudomonadota bacterium]